MSVKAEDLRDACFGLVRELTRLSQLNRPLSMDEFFGWSENEEFLSKIFKKYGEYIRALGNIDPHSANHDAELVKYIENALARHVNVISPGTYGVVDDAYLLAINVVSAIDREADEL